MGKPSASTDATYSAAEAADLVRSMSDVDKVRFVKASHYYSFGGARSPKDLRQEVIRRTIEGVRRCPIGISMVTFLNQAMRSIAFSDRKAVERAPKLIAVPNDGPGSGVLDGIDPRLSPEDLMIQEATRSEIKAAVLAVFDDDAVGAVLAEGIMEGMEGEELRELVDLGVKEFATKRRFVRRRIDKAFPRGWKP
jgi:hypothetical protein